MSRVGEQMLRASSKATELIARGWGEHFPMWLVGGYPKSGTSWVSFVVADYLGLPRPDRYYLPVAMPAVLHGHWAPHPRLRRVLYVYRDGRDVMVSFYFFRMGRLHSTQLPRYARQMRRRYHAAFGTGFDPGDIRAHLPAFIELEMHDPRESRLSWPEHVDRWMPRFGRPGTAALSYEELLERPVATIGAALEHLGESVDEQRLEAAVERFTFARMAKRDPGMEDRSSFFRRGVAGDWKNHFTKEAAATFDRFAGRQLIDLGYEADRSWVAAVR